MKVYVEISQSSMITISDILNCVLTFFILLGALCLTIFEEMKKVKTSFVLTILWPCFLIALIPEFLHVNYDFLDPPCNIIFHFQDTKSLSLIYLWHLNHYFHLHVCPSFCPAFVRRCHTSAFHPINSSRCLNSLIKVAPYVLGVDP